MASTIADAAPPPAPRPLPPGGARGVRGDGGGALAVPARLLIEKGGGGLPFTVLVLHPPTPSLCPCFALWLRASRERSTATSSASARPASFMARLSARAAASSMRTRSSTSLPESPPMSWRRDSSASPSARRRVALSASSYLERFSSSPSSSFTRRSRPALSTVTFFSFLRSSSFRLRRSSISPSRALTASLSRTRCVVAHSSLRSKAPLRCLPPLLSGVPLPPLTSAPLPSLSLSADLGLLLVLGGLSALLKRASAVAASSAVLATDSFPPNVTRDEGESSGTAMGPRPGETGGVENSMMPVESFLLCRNLPFGRGVRAPPYPLLEAPE
mmetsp:Transcript_35827/g.113258  ORF Transcript_35827/g.113258 Transcript_35827/m.113258 type:complete len:330 (+) Transcript_35827:149-1138(+)